MTASLETAAEFFLTPVQRPPRRTTGAADAGLRGASVTGARNGEASEQLHERIRKRIFEKDGKASYVPQDLMPGSMYREKPGSCTDASLLLLYERMQRMNHRHKQHDLEEIMFEINRQAVASESFAREYRLDTSTRGPFAEFKLRKLARTLLHRGGTPSHNDSRDASPPSWESYDNDQFTSYASTVKSTGITPGAMLIGLENHTTRAVGSAALQRKASSSKTSSRSGMPPRHSNTSRGSDGSSVGGFDVRDGDNGGGGLEYDSSNAAAPFPITEWHGEMPLPMDHGVLVDPVEAFRQDREVGWNSSILPPRSVPLIYQQKAAAARSSSHLLPEDSIELPAVEAMLKTIKEHGVAGADPTNATTQTVCALFTYGQPQQRSERLQVVAPVLSRIAFPSKPKSYRTILEEKILSGEIDLTNDEIRETVSGLLDSVPPPARLKKDHQKTLRSRKQLPPRSETAPPTTTTASATTSGKTFHPKDAMKATSDPVVERASSCTPTLLDESSPLDSPIAKTPSQSDPKDSNVLEMRPSAAPVVVDSNELLHSSEAAERGKVPKTREERNPAKNIKEAPAVKKSTKALPSVPAATKKAPNKNATAHQAKTLPKPPPAEVDTKPHSEPTADNASNSFVPPVAPTSLSSVAGCVQTEEDVTSSQMAEVQVTTASTDTMQIEQPSRVPAAVDDAPLVGQLSAVETADASQPLAADVTHAAESRKDTTEAKAVAQTAASPSPSKKKVPAVISPKARSTISNQRVEVKETSKVGYKGKSAPATKKSTPKTETVDVVATATPAQGGEETYDDDDFAPESQDAYHAASSVSLTTPSMLPLSAKRAPPKKSPRVAAPSPQPKSTSPQRSGYKGKISSVKSPKAVSPPAVPSHTHIVDNTTEPDAYDDDDFTAESPNRAAQHTAVPAASVQGVAATVTATDDSEYAGTGYDDDNFEEGSPARDEVARVSNTAGAESEAIDQDHDDDIHASDHERDDAYDDDEFDAPPPAGADTNRQFADIGNANEDDYSSDDPAQSDHDKADSHETTATTAHTPPSVISAAPPPDESEGDAYANALSLALRLRMKSKVSPRDAPPAVMIPPQEVLDMVVQSGLTSRTVSAEPQQRPDSKHRGRSRGSTAGGDSRPQYTARDFFSDDHNNSGVVDDASMYLLRPTSRASADNRSRTPTAITPTMSDAPFSWSRSTPPPDDDDDEDRYLNDEAMSDEQRKRSKKSKKDKRKSGGGGGGSVTLEGFVEIDVGMQPESSGGASSKKKRSSSKKLRNTEFEPPAIPAEPTPTGSREEGRRRRNTNKGMAFDL